MTCKVSLCKSIQENMKHHLASVFAVCLLFFIKLITFFLQVQNYATRDYTFNSDKEYVLEQLQKMTLPGYGIAILVMFIALFLAFDFFRYLHSKKQTDFFDSLPVRRKDAFITRILSICIIFAVPLIICLSLETVLLVVYHFFQVKYLMNILWSLACMLLIFLATMFTGVLAMIMTGHPVIALLGFGVFSAYAPILLQYIFPAYASQYFDTYASSNEFSSYLYYASPISASIKLVHENAYRSWAPKGHMTDFIAILILIVFVGILSYILFQKRPSESAGRAMAFTKCNPVIRILLVIPLTLYVGLYLSQVASIGSKIWMVFGFVAGTILLHGIIESIFQFDIRGLWSHKKQMLGCFLVSMAIALIFWVDLFHYDEYLPKQNELESIAVDLGEYYDISEVDGISGEYLDTAYQLAQNLVTQKYAPENRSVQVDTLMTQEYTSEVHSVQIEYRFKNGTVKKRRYYIDTKANRELIDKLYASKEYKDDICELYRDDWKNVKELRLSDGLTAVTLNLTPEERNLLFETYLAEFTPFTYSQKQASTNIAHFIISKDTAKDSDRQYYCYVYSEFTQTIALLDKYIQNDKSIQHFGAVSESPMKKYNIRSIDIFSDDYPTAISERETIEALKEHILLYDYDSIKTIDTENFYEIQVEFATSTGSSYASGTIPREIADKYKR